MKYTVKGKNTVDLDNKNFLAQGGEGSVYVIGKTAYKIYNDPKKMLPVGKIQELSALTDKNIIKPENIILDNKNHEIGYTMRFVDDTYALCQLFTKAFRQRNNLSHDMMFKLIQSLQNLIKHIHEKKILVVDLNEMNFLASTDFKEIYAIDVDSYQTPNYKATAIMESIRDRHTKGFNEGSDWFSFAILAFQMFIGIHPYKGKHPSINNIDDRMMQNISVYHKDVDVPKVCYDFNIIPKNYENWFKAVLDNGKRLPPPNEGDIVQLIQTIKKIVGSNNFTIDETMDTTDDIINYVYSYGTELCITEKSVFLNGKDLKFKVEPGHIGFTPKMNHAINAYKENNMLKLFDINSQKDIHINLEASDVMAYKDRIYVKSVTNIVEVMFNEMGTTIMPSMKIVGTCLDTNASKLYPGVLVQNFIGSYFISLFPNTGECYQIPMKQLTGYRIIDAKFENNVLMVVGIKMGGKYDKMIFRFNDTYSEYDMRVVPDIQPNGFNFVVLDKGICANINENEEVELFSNKKDSANIKVIKDNAINGSMTLYKNCNTVMFSSGSKMYTLKMKTP